MAKRVSILVYDNFALQTKYFIESFKNVNNSGEYDYEFIVVNTPDTVAYTETQLLDKVDDSYKYSFIKKIDDIISTEPDFLIIADGRTFALRSIENVLANLEIADPQWQLCGDYEFGNTPVVFTSDYTIVDYFIFINFGFAILNPKNMQTNHVEMAKQLIPDDMNLYLDRYLLNIMYDKKIIECSICIDKNAHCPGLTLNNDPFIKNVIMDVYSSDDLTEGNVYNFSHFYMYKYLDFVSGSLRREIISRAKTYLPMAFLSDKHSDYILNQMASLTDTETTLFIPDSSNE